MSQTVAIVWLIASIDCLWPLRQREEKAITMGNANGDTPS
jgi:uncharacterized membrane protein YqjE